jgi:signal transduction histidine kinase
MDNSTLIRLLQNPTDLKQLLSEIALEIGQTFQADICLIISGTEPSQRVEIGFWGSKITFNPNAPNILSHPLIQATLETTETLVFPNLETTSLWEKDHWLESKLSLETLVLQASQFQGQINGIILIGYHQIKNWTENNQAILINVIPLVAIAISQQQLKQKNFICQQQQTLLKHLSQSIPKIPELDQIYRLSLVETARVLEVNRGLLLTLKYQQPLYKKHRQDPQATITLASQWSIDFPDKSPHITDPFNLSDCFLCQNALKNAPQSLAIIDFEEFQKKSKSKKLSPIFQNPNLGSILIIPLTRDHGDQYRSIVLGFLVFQHLKPRYWYQDEIELTTWVSNQISNAMIQNQSFKRVQTLVEERTSQLKWSLDVQSKLSEKMRQQIEQLQQLNQLKDEFMSSMSHELKTPLATMKLAIKMLRQETITPEKQAKYLDILDQEWHREYNLIQDLLTLQKLESSQTTLRVEEINLADILTKIKAYFSEKWQQEKGLTLVINYNQNCEKISTDAESFNYILNELLSNAGKYSDPNTTVTLEIKPILTDKGRQLMIVVSNYGLGISPEELPFIFDKFRRGKGVTDRAVPGTGLGLALVKAIVQNLNGTIDVTSEPTPESNLFITTFTLKLP